MSGYSYPVGAKLPWPTGGPAYEPGKNGAPRQEVAYRCTDGHRMLLAFAAGAQLPAAWECRHCGQPAAREGEPEDGAATPLPGYGSPYERLRQSKSRPRPGMEYVRERRTDAELEVLLAERLAEVRRQRGDVA